MVGTSAFEIGELADLVSRGVEVEVGVKVGAVVVGRCSVMMRIDWNELLSPLVIVTMVSRSRSS